MAAIGALSRVILFVSNVEKVGAFYTDILGLEPNEKTHEPGMWLELESGGMQLALHKASKPGKGKPSDPHKLVFFVKNVAKAREKLVKRGAKMFELKTFGDLSLCDGLDPEGHRFQLSNRG